MAKRKKRSHILTQRERQEMREWQAFRRGFEQGYKTLLRRQARRCAICSDFNRDPRKALAVDHSADGEVRGLLCDRCNMGLGLFDHRPGLLQSAIDYLTGPPTEFRVWSIPQDAPSWFDRRASREEPSSS